MSQANGDGGASAAGLRIHLLGGFEVRTCETTLIGAHWPHRKAKAILKLLALQPSRSIHREQLLDRLWPNLDPSAAANNLRQNIHHLRRTLSPSGIGAPVILNEMVSLAAGIWIDADAFRRQAGAAQASDDPTLYEETLALYRGDVLPEDLYEEWTEPAREELRNLRLRLLLQLSHRYESRGRVDEALRAAEQAWEIDPLAEEPHYRLIQIYMSSGRRDRAVRQYQRFRQSLDRSLGLAPSEHMEALYQKLLVGREKTAAPRAETPNNLPARVTSFIGRESEAAEIGKLLGSRRRLITLVGAPGCGKTRLALEAAAEQLQFFPDGVWWVDLAPIADAAVVARAITQVLGLAEAPNQDPVDALTIFSRTRQLLIILDNCEHLIAACATIVNKILHSCPTISILATSREPLDTAGESVLTVSPLPAPPESHASAAALLSFDAVRLLIDRVQAVLSGFRLTDANSTAVARLCARLEGIPLAIELVAARARAFSIEEIVERLDQSFLLSPQTDQATISRHGTLNAALDWSYDLLSAEEQALLRRLAVFAGGFDLSTAEDVCSAEPVEKAQVMELLLRLVDGSLVTTVRTTDSGVRYRLLEPLRQYAAKRLQESEEEDELRERHARLFLARIIDVEDALVRSTAGLRDYTVWTIQEHANIRAALRWSLDAGEREKALRLASCLTTSFWMHGHATEGQRWMDEALSAEGQVSSEVLGWALHQAAWINVFARGDLQRAMHLAEQSVALLRQTDEKWKLAYACGALGTLMMMLGDLEHADPYAREAHSGFLELGNDFGLANSLALLWLIAQARGDCWLADVFQAAAFSLFKQIDEPWHTGVWLTRGAQLYSRQSDYRRAASLATASLTMAAATSDQHVSTLSLDIMAAAASVQDQPERAARLFGATRAILESMGLARSSLDPSIYESHIGPIREALGEDAFRREWAAGSQMSWEQAIAYALGSEGLRALPTSTAAKAV